MHPSLESPRTHTSPRHSSTAPGIHLSQFRCGGRVGGCGGRGRVVEGCFWWRINSPGAGWCFVLSLTCVDYPTTNKISNWCGPSTLRPVSRPHKSSLPRHSRATKPSNQATETHTISPTPTIPPKSNRSWTCWAFLTLSNPIGTEYRSSLIKWNLLTCLLFLSLNSMKLHPRCNGISIQIESKFEIGLCRVCLFMPLNCMSRLFTRACIILINEKCQSDLINYMLLTSELVAKAEQKISSGIIQAQYRMYSWGGLTLFSLQRNLIL